MKKKITNTIVDIILIAFVFFLTDTVTLKIFHSENGWLDLGIYILFYAAVFGIKSGIVLFCRRFKAEKN